NVTSLSQSRVNKSTEIGPNARNPVMPVTVENIWPAAREMLRTMLNPDIFNLWFAPIRATALEGDLLTLQVANDFCEVWLKDNYLDLIRGVLARTSGQEFKVKFRVASNVLESAPAVARANLSPREEPEPAEQALRELPFNTKNT